MGDARRVVHLRDEKSSAHGSSAARLRETDRLLARLAERQHGVVARRKLFEHGIHRGEIDSRIERGQLHPVHRGVYAVGHRLLDVDGRRMAAVLACGPDAVLSHRSAGRLLGIVPPSDGLPEVTVPSSRGRPGVVVHRGSLPADEVTEVRGIPVTSLARTLFDLAGSVSERELERAFHEAEVRRLTGRISLPQMLVRYPRRRGAPAVRRLLAAREPEGVTRNDFEELFVAFLDRHGLPRPLLNATLPLRGRLLEPDCTWRDQRLLVELDGREVHGTDRAFEGDRLRDRVLLVEGWRSVRVTWRQLRDEPDEVAADLKWMLGELGRRARPPGK